MVRRILAGLWVFALAISCLLSFGCSSRNVSTADSAAVALASPLVGSGFSSANLQLQMKTASCVANQVQDFIQVKNAGTTAVPLSQLTIKLWVKDTSGSNVAPQINAGGCLTSTTAGCFHQVSGVTVTAVPFAPGCGPDPQHQANWEITIANTDPSSIAAGVTWSNIQASIHLANYANFVPGSGSWYTSCLSGTAFAPDPYVAMYIQGNQVFTSQINSPSCRSPHGSQQLTGHFVPPVSSAPVIGPLAASTVVDLAIALPSRNPQGMNALAAQIANPTSSQFRQYLSLSDLTAQFGPTATDYQALIAWAQANGLTVGATYPHRFSVHVRGTAASIEKALYVNLNQAIRPDGSTFYAPDREPSLDVGAPVLGVVGLDNFIVPTKLAGSASNGTYTGSDLRNAYLPCTSLTGAGQSVGIAIFGGYKHADVTQYIAGGPAVTLTDLKLDASGNWASGLLPINSNWQLEATLDVEAAIAMAPGLDSVVTFGAPGSGSGCAQSADIASEMLTYNAIKQFSNSGGFSICSGWSIPVIQAMAMTGQSFFEASGDNGGSVAGNPVFTVLSNAWVTSVGGTVLGMSGVGQAWSFETAWENSGGGVENVGTCPHPTNVFCIPSWQVGLPTINQVSNLYRNEPDLALPARDVFVVMNGQTYTVSGTSIGAPLMAGYTAVVNQQICKNNPAGCTSGKYGVGFANPAIYAVGATYSSSSSSTPYANSFHDINSNGASTPALPPGPGYDLSTGWGSPKCGLVDQLSCVTCSGTTPTAGVPGSSTCATLQSDPNNCGSCGNVCPGTTCVKGACTTQSQCTPGESRCCDANGCGTDTSSNVPNTITAQVCGSDGAWHVDTCVACQPNGSNIRCSMCSGVAMCNVSHMQPGCVCP